MLDGILSVINMLGNTIESLKGELAAAQRQLAQAQQDIAALQESNGHALRESEELAEHARRMADPA